MHRAIYFVVAILAAALLIPSTSVAGTASRSFAKRQILKDLSSPATPDGIDVGECRHDPKGKRLTVCLVSTPEHVSPNGETYSDESWINCVGPRGFVTDARDNNKCFWAYVYAFPEI